VSKGNSTRVFPLILWRWDAVLDFAGSNVHNLFGELVSVAWPLWFS